VAYVLGLVSIAALAVIWYERHNDAASNSPPPSAAPAPPVPAPAQPPGAAAPTAEPQAQPVVAGPDVEARQTALRRLDGDPSDVARATLLGALRDDPDPTVRLFAVELLLQRALSRGDADGQIEAALNAAVSDPDENVGEGAIDALAELVPGAGR
jgi:hypothetical protein